MPNDVTVRYINAPKFARDMNKPATIEQLYERCDRAWERWLWMQSHSYTPAEAARAHRAMDQAVHNLRARLSPHPEQLPLLTLSGADHAPKELIKESS